MHIGFEFGDLGIKAAVLVDGTARPLQTLPGPFENLVLVRDSVEQTPLGIAFPGFLRSIGTQATVTTAKGVMSAADLALALLSAYHKLVTDRFGAISGTTVIAVPSALSSQSRSALVGCAKAAGFGDAVLVDACIPATTVFAGGTDKPTTQLVYSLGYGECEHALLRVVRGRVKVLESCVLSSVSGQRFDARVMEAIVLALREHNIFLGLKTFQPAQWRAFRTLAAAGRDALGRKAVADVTLPATLVASGPPIRLTLSANGLAGQIVPALEDTIEDVLAMLERHDVKPDTLDAVIALGDTATVFPAADLLAQTFPGLVQAGHSGTVAAAAAMYASWLERNGPDSVGGGNGRLLHYLAPYKRDAAFSGVDVRISGSVRLVSAVETLPAASEPAAASAVSGGASARDGSQVPPPRESPAPRDGAPNPHRTMGLVAPLIEQGRLLEAAQMLLQMVPQDLAPGAPPATIAQAPAVPAAPVAPPQPATPPSTARLLMDEAKGLLGRGLQGEAVNLAHRAHGEDRLDPEIFTDMLRVHLMAALALKEPAFYRDAVRLLHCALSHDPASRGLRDGLLLRHLLHAEAMLDERDTAGAREAIEAAAALDPAHDLDAALRLRLAALTRGSG